MAARKTGKADLNQASRKEPVEAAGPKPAKAEKIVKLRDRRGTLESMDQLRELARLSRGEREKVQKRLEIEAEAAATGMVAHGAEAARDATETVKKSADRLVDQVQGVGIEAERLAPVTRIGWNWVSLWPEQALHTVVMARRLMSCRTLPEMFQVQSEFALASLDQWLRRFTTAAELVAYETGQARDKGRERRAA